MSEVAKVSDKNQSYIDRFCDMAKLYVESCPEPPMMAPPAGAVKGAQSGALNRSLKNKTRYNDPTKRQSALK